MCHRWVNINRSHRWVNIKVTGGSRWIKWLQLKITREIYEPKATLNHSIDGSPRALPRKSLTILIGIRPIFEFFSHRECVDIIHSFSNGIRAHAHIFIWMLPDFRGNLHGTSGNRPDIKLMHICFIKLSVDGICTALPWPLEKPEMIPKTIKIEFGFGLNQFCSTLGPNGR